jgi:lipid A 3-O-deacylase
MTRRCRFLAVVAALLALPVVATGQSDYGAVSPPNPSGPPLLPPPPADLPRSTWVEDRSAVLPAAGWSPGAAALTAPETAWPVTQSGSACHFDSPEATTIGLVAEPAWIQILQGAYFSSSLGPGIGAFDYLPMSVRHGWNLGNPYGPGGVVPGNWEMVLDVTGAAVTSSYGNWFAGSSAFLRYNLAGAGSPFVPYLQGGVGVIANDVYRDHGQRAIGQAVEFLVHAQVGLKWYIAPNLSLDVEGGFQHISNAGLASRNAGVNAFGGSLGFTYYFPWGAE